MQLHAWLKAFCLQHVPKCALHIFMLQPGYCTTIASVLVRPTPHWRHRLAVVVLPGCRKPPSFCPRVGLPSRFFAAAAVQECACVAPPLLSTQNVLPANPSCVEAAHDTTVCAETSEFSLPPTPAENVALFFMCLRFPTQHGWTVHAGCACCAWKALRMMHTLLGGTSTLISQWCSGQMQCAG